VARTGSSINYAITDFATSTVLAGASISKTKTILTDADGTDSSAFCLTRLLAVDFYDFYHQHFSRFHTFMAIIMLKPLTLMSSTSFGDYLILGAHYQKFSQIGRNPRPTSLP
jgi:hypothetical protein